MLYGDCSDGVVEYMAADSMFTQFLDKPIECLCDKFEGLYIRVARWEWESETCDYDAAADYFTESIRDYLWEKKCEDAKDQCAYDSCEDATECWIERCNVNSECLDETCTYWTYDQFQNYWIAEDCLG